MVEGLRIGGVWEYKGLSPPTTCRAISIQGVWGIILGLSKDISGTRASSGLGLCRDNGKENGQHPFMV